jgi:type IV pilus assembly protein PilC
LKQVTAFTRQLSILQDAGLPILRSLKILENQAKPGALKNSLMDICEEIEGGSTLSEAMGKSPKAFDRLYVNMIKAGEAGGALEIILKRLADFQERSQSLRRKVKGALIYPVVVIMVATAILTFIMLKIVPEFVKIFKEFKVELPAPTLVLMAISEWVVGYFWLIPAIPIAIWLTIKLLRKFKFGRVGWDLFVLKLPVIGMLTEKNIMARTTRTLGTLVSSGVPILEALNITRDTAGNAVFEHLFGKVSESIREGESIAKPMKENSRPGFHPMALFFWVALFAVPVAQLIFLKALGSTGIMIVLVSGIVGALIYIMRMSSSVVDDLVVNMVDVGEETGELDTMLYKVADNFDEEVSVLTEGLMKLMEPLMIVFLGGAVGFIVIALFMPLIKLITALSGGK